MDNEFGEDKKRGISMPGYALLQICNNDNAIGMESVQLKAKSVDRIIACVNACAGIENPEQFINDARSYSHETVTGLCAARDAVIDELKVEIARLKEIETRYNNLIKSMNENK